MVLSTTAAIKRAYSDLPLQKLFDYTAGKASFLCTCALRSKIKKVLTVHMGLDCAVFRGSRTREQIGGPQGWAMGTTAGPAPWFWLGSGAPSPLASSPPSEPLFSWCQTVVTVQRMAMALLKTDKKIRWQNSPSTITDLLA